MTASDEITIGRVTHSEYWAKTCTYDPKCSLLQVDEAAIRASQDAKWRERIIASTEGKRGKGYGSFCDWCTEQWTEGGCGEPEPCPFRKLAEEGVG